MGNVFTVFTTTIAALGFAGVASAATVTAGDSSTFDGGFATFIQYDDAAARGSNNDRDNPLNALGATDGDFFEIGTGSEVILQFGRAFTSPGTVVEVTFGSTSGFAESANLFVGNFGDDTGTYAAIDQNPVTNASAQGSGFTFTFAGGPFDALLIRDQSSQTPGGFDIDSVQVSPVPLPAGAVLLLTALGGVGALRSWRKTA